MSHHRQPDRELTPTPGDTGAEPPADADAESPTSGLVGDTAEAPDAPPTEGGAQLVAEEESRDEQSPPPGDGEEPTSSETESGLLPAPARARIPRSTFAQILPDLLAIALITGTVLLSFRHALSSGLVAYERDTELFFFPLLAWFGEEFKAGAFPLWNPLIFTGYPVFSDGESGLAYPLTLALLRILPVEQAFIWLRISSVLIAGAGMYTFCRVLRVGVVGSLVGALTFALGSFFSMQVHHENVTRTAAWLPWALAAVEAGLRASGARRHLLFTGGAAALGMAGLGLHPQVLAMSCLAFGTYVVFRVLTGPPGTRPITPGRAAGASVASSRARRVAREAVGRLGLVAWIALWVGGLGIALAAVQIIPLAYLGASTFRGSQTDYWFATSYAMPAFNLVNLVFPYFFRGPDDAYWSLWAKWETTPYVGIAPLVLGLFGVALSRRREAIYFLALALVAIWLALASYAPLDLYAQVWSLPGFSAFRVPGRYIYLAVLAWSVLAALGADAFLTGRPGRARGRVVTAGAILTTTVVLVVGVAAGVHALGESVVDDPEATAAWIGDSYLAQRHHEEGLTVGEVYRGLASSLDLGNRRTAFALVLLLSTGALLAAAVLGRARSLAAEAALIALIVFDLLAFASTLHRREPVDEIVRESGGTSYLAAAAESSRGSSRRVFTPGREVPSMEFNRLVPFGIEDVGGYSSPDLREHYSYWTMARSTQNRLLDLANVGYIVQPRAQGALPSYRGVPFDPERPLLLGSRGSASGFESFTLGGERAHRLQVIAALTRSLEVTDDEVVAEIRLVDRDGTATIVPLRAGRDVAEWAYDRPDVRGRVRHRQPSEIAHRKSDVHVLDNTPYSLSLYYSEHDLAAPLDVARVEARHVHQNGGIEIYGIGLYNVDSGRTEGVIQSMRSKLRQAYQDDQVTIYENTQAYPRAYVVPLARKAASGGTALSAMIDTPFEPASEVMLEADADWPAPASSVAPPDDDPWTPGPPPTPAEWIEGDAGRVSYRASAPEGGFLIHVALDYPGWRAWVDGQETPIYRANGLFRAVPLRPGQHVVELRYEPGAVRLGLGITLAALATALLSLIALFVKRRLSFRTA